MKKVYLSLFTFLLLNTKASVEQKIGQLFGIALPLYAPQKKVNEICNLVNRHNIGAIMLDRRGTIAQQRRIVNHIIKTCKNAPLILQDLECGLTMRLKDAPVFPKAMTCGAIATNERITQMAREIARQAHLMGVDIVLAPVLDINTNPENPIINDRSFGDSKENVTEKAQAYIRGLQQDHFVVGCAKHFPGHGDASVDSHLSLPTLHYTKERLMQTELYPFKKIIEQKEIACVMPGHLFIPALDNETCTTFSKPIVTDLLKNKLGFNGLIVTDALRMGALSTNNSNEAIVKKSFQAGNDLLLCPDDIENGISTLSTALKNGEINKEDLLKSIQKIENIKKRLKTSSKKFIPSTIKKDLFSPHARTLKKEIFKEALTIVQDKKKMLPLNKHNQYAHIQIGGKENSIIGEKLQENLDIMHHHLSSQPHGIEISELCEDLKEYKKIIVSLFDINKNDVHSLGIAQNIHPLIKKLEKDHEIILVIFGSPYSLKFFKYLPTILMAYEEDDDAQTSAAECLTGSLQARGKLSISF